MSKLKVNRTVFELSFYELENWDSHWHRFRLSWDRNKRFSLFPPVSKSICASQCGAFWDIHSGSRDKVKIPGLCHEKEKEDNE